MPLTNSPGYRGTDDDSRSSDQPRPRVHLSRLQWAILCLALLTILLAGLDFVLPAYGTVRGSVRDLDGNPLQVGVFVEGLAATTRTDASGRFVLAHIPSGQHTLTIRYGSDQIAFQVDIPAEDSLNIGQLQVDTGT